MKRLSFPRAAGLPLTLTALLLLVFASGCPKDSCGDGVVDDGEECDDGEMNSDTEQNACRLACTLPACGDAIFDDATEECDDGNTMAGDGCDDLCLIEPVCLTDMDCETTDAACLMTGVLCRCNVLDDRCEIRPCSSASDCPAAEEPAEGWACIGGSCVGIPDPAGLCARAISAQPVLTIGSTGLVAAEAVDGSGNLVGAQTFEFTSSDTGVATVDMATGEVTAVGAGMVTITAAVVGGSAAAGCPDSDVTLEVLPAVAAGDIRVTAILAAAGTPVVGARVVLDIDVAGAVTTDASGMATFTGAGGGPHDLTILSEGHQYVSIVQTTSRDILVALIPNAPLFDLTPNGMVCDESDMDPTNDCPADYSCFEFRCRPLTCTPTPNLITTACLNQPLPAEVCARGFECVAGACVPQACNPANGDADCSPGFVCNGASNECEAPAVDLTAPFPCPDIYFLEVGGVCQAIECESDAEVDDLRCAPGFVCVDNGCHPDINGTIGCIDFSLAPIETVGAAIGGASLQGDLIDLNFESLIGTNRPSFLDIPGLFTGPAEIPAGATVEINQIIATNAYEAFGAPGEHVIWTLGGRINIIDLIPVLGPLIDGDVEIGLIIVGILPFFDNFYSGLATGAVIGGDLVPLDLELQVQMGLRSEIGVPMLPPTPPNASDDILTALVLGGVLQPVTGFTPLGLSAGVDDPKNPDGIVEENPRIAMAPMHEGLEANSASRYMIVSMGLNFDNPISVSGRTILMSPGDAIPEMTSLPGDYLDFAYGVTLDTVTRSIDTSGANSVPEADFHRVTMRPAGGELWQVYLPLGTTTYTLIDPATVETDTASGVFFSDRIHDEYSVAAVDLNGSLDFEGLMTFNGDDANRLTEIVGAFSLVNIRP